MSYISLLNQTNINTDILYSTELSASNLTITGSITLPNNSLLLSYLKNGTSGYIIICNTSGVPTYTIISGNATISNTGVLTIGSGQVSNNMLVHPSFSLGGTTINLGDSITTISSLNITNNISALYGTFTRGTSNIANPILSTPSIICGSGNNGVVLIESVTGWGTYLFQNGYDFYIDNGYSSSTSSTINIGTIYGQTMTIGKVGCILNLPGTIVTLNVTTGTFTNAIFTRGTSNIANPILSTPSIICGSGNNGVVLIESVTGWGSYLQQNNYDFYLDNGYSGSPSTINIGTIYGQTMTIGKVGCILNLPGTLNVPVQSIALNSLPYSPVSSSFYYLCSSGTGNAWTQSVNATYISAVAVSSLTFNITMIPTGIASFYGMNYSTSLSYNASTNNLTAQTITCNSINNATSFSTTSPVNNMLATTSILIGNVFTPPTILFSGATTFNNTSPVVMSSTLGVSGLISGSAGLTISGAITVPTNSIALNSLITTGASSGQVLTTNGAGVNTWNTLSSITNASNVNISSSTTNTSYSIPFVSWTVNGYYPLYENVSLKYNPSTSIFSSPTVSASTAILSNSYQGLTASSTIAIGTATNNININTNTITLNSQSLVKINYYTTTSLTVGTGITTSYTVLSPMVAALTYRNLNNFYRIHLDIPTTLFTCPSFPSSITLSIGALSSMLVAVNDISGSTTGVFYTVLPVGSSNPSFRFTWLSPTVSAINALFPTPYGTLGEFFLTIKSTNTTNISAYNIGQGGGAQFWAEEIIV